MRTMTLPQSSQTGTTDMFFIKRREKTCFILFIIAIALSCVFAVCVALFGLTGNYPAAIVSTAISAFTIYCIPIYYNNASRCKITAILYGAILDGIGDFDALEAETGIKKEAAEKLLSRAIAEKMILNISIENNKINIRE